MSCLVRSRPAVHSSRILHAAMSFLTLSLGCGSSSAPATSATMPAPSGTTPPAQPMTDAAASQPTNDGASTTATGEGGTAEAGTVLADATSMGARTVVPITQNVINPTTGAIAQTISIQIGGSPPIQALLDTGSSGVRVLASALATSDYMDTGVASAYSYGSGLVLTGTIGMATVTIGGAPTTAPIPIEVVQSFTGSIGNDSGGPIDGLVAIVGAIMNGGARAINPLTAIGSGQWIIDVAPPGGTTGGTLILNPTASDQAGYTLFQLPRETTINPMDPPANGMANGWASDHMPACVANLDTATSFCQNALIDSGAWGIHEPSAPSSSTPWATGTHAELTFKNDSGETVSEPFIVGTTPGGSTVKLPPSPSATGAMNTGPLPLFSFSALYDSVAGTIGLKAHP